MNWLPLFYYDATSQSGLRWRVERRCGKGRVHVNPGDMAGYKTSGGYWQVEVDNVPYLCHRILYEIMEGPIPDGKVVDHWNGDKADNRWGNLRLVDRPLNNRNVAMRTDNKSGVTGVYRSSQKQGRYNYWTAECCNLDGTKQRASYSIEKLGEAEAFRLACKYREKMIEKLNAEGAGYTERHGKEEI